MSRKGDYPTHGRLYTSLKSITEVEVPEGHFETLRSMMDQQ